MTNIIILILSIVTLLSIILSIIFYNKIIELNNDLKDKDDKLSRKDKDLDRAKNDLIKNKKKIDIESGDNVIMKNYKLSTKGENPIKFEVTYELEVLEVSLDSVKVKAIDYTSYDNYALDNKNKQAILNFMNSSWHKKHDVELVMDNKKRRSIKLKELGI